MSYITPALTRFSSRQEGYEVRLTGLNQVVTAKELKDFFSAAIRVIDVHLHPSLPGQDGLIKQWAQLWTCSDEEVDKCLTLKESLASKGIICQLSTISRAPVAPVSPWNTSQPPLPTTFALPPTSPSFDHLPRPDMVYRDQEYRTGSRNLYVLGVPIDLTQTQFKALFVPFGMVQHSTLLSQLDNMGRRRGFVLMSNHEEAARALVAMNGKVIESADERSGSRIDVSWALIQRESRHFSGSGIGAMPNRVIHPPTLPLRREPTIEASVMVDNLDPNVFSTPGVIQEVFSHFGPILRVTTIPGTLQAIIAFENILSAARLIGSDGMMMGGRIINTRPLIPTTGVDTLSSPPPLSLPPAPTMTMFTSLPTQGAHQINVSQPPFDPFSSDTLFRQAKSTPIRITSSSPVTSSSPTRDTNPSSDPPAHEMYSSDTGTSQTKTSTTAREKWSW